MVSIKFPMEDETTEAFDHAKMYAVVQRELLRVVEFKNDEFRFYIAPEEVDSHMQELFNLVVNVIDLNSFVKFLFYIFMQKITEQECNFMRTKGSVVLKLLQKYNVDDLGYAMSIARSHRDLTDDQMRTLIQDYTSLDIADFYLIFEEIFSADPFLGGDYESLTPQELDELVTGLLEAANREFGGVDFTEDGIN